MIIANSVYISGPMSGLPDHNFPAFHGAAKKLRNRGYQVINPAELDIVEGQIKPWAWYLRRDLVELVKCEFIYLLTGWEQSKGAQLEMHVAGQLGIHLLNPEIIAPHCVVCGTKNDVYKDGWYGFRCRKAECVCL